MPEPGDSRREGERDELSGTVGDADGRMTTLAKAAYSLVADTIAAVGEDDVPRMAAAMAYWLLVTMAPLVLVLSAVGAFVFRDGSPAADIVGGAPVPTPDFNALDLIGGTLALAGPYASAVAAIFVIVGAMAVFAQFVGALNVIWKTGSQRGALYQLVRHNLLGLLLLLVFAVASFVALIVSAVADRVLGIVTQVIVAAGGAEPVVDPTILGQWFVGALAAWGLFSIAFWIVPQRKIRLVDVVPGAALTAVAYQIGVTVVSGWLPETQKFAIYGVFSVFVAVIVFIYYVALIALVGAEFTRQWVLRAEARRGSVT